MGNEKTLFDDVIKAQSAQDGVVALVGEAHRNAVAHGFYEQAEKNTALLMASDVDLGEGYLRDFKLSQLSKIGEECGEACHAMRKGQNDEFLEELADICIRVFDLAGFCDTPEKFAHALLTKMERNIGRDRLHGRLC
jgi:hypothetical protein